jgi:hypothetical protein
MKNVEKILVFLAFVIGGIIFLIALTSLFFALPITQKFECINAIVIPEFKKQSQWFAMISLMFAVFEISILSMVLSGGAKKNNQNKERISVCLLGLYFVAFLVFGYIHEETDRLEKTLAAKYVLVDDREFQFSGKSIKKYVEENCSFPASHSFLVCGYDNERFKWHEDTLHKFYISKELSEKMLHKRCESR